MAEIKTKVTNESVTDFLNKVANEQKRKDSFVLLELFKKITQHEPKMWGPSIIGFGTYHYKSSRSKQEGDWMLTGFSPRAASLTLYLMSGFEDYQDIIQNLGKAKTSVGCLYINKLQDVDLKILEDLIKKSYTHMKKINNVD